MVVRFRSKRTHLRVAVEHAEIGDDYGDGERDDENAAEGAERPDDEARPGLGDHVAVADGGHGDDGPPEPLRDALEVVLRVGVAIKLSRTLLFQDKIFSMILFEHSLLF